MKTKANRMTLDWALTPTQMECGNCKSKMTVYPYPIPEGIGYCPNCSPLWLKSFAIWGLNQERQKHALEVMK